jgi:hypothetical protein
MTLQDGNKVERKYDRNSHDGYENRGNLMK